MFCGASRPSLVLCLYDEAGVRQSSADLRRGHGGLRDVAPSLVAAESLSHRVAGRRRLFLRTLLLLLLPAPFRNSFSMIHVYEYMNMSYKISFIHFSF